MPNWCENHLRLDGLSKEVASQVVDNILTAKNENSRGIFPEFLSVLHPIPNLKEVMSEGMLKCSAIAEGQTVEEYINSWEFNWRRNNWMVKWDIFINYDRAVDAVTDYGDDCIEIEFLSPWAPPVGTYQHLHQEGVKVQAYYCEFGLDYCGLWAHGEDLDYRISDKDYPENIDEMFHITERTYDWGEDPTPL